MFRSLWYNDLVKNHDKELIFDTINRFGDYVRHLPNEDNSANTVTVGTLLYPPQLAWFVDNGPEPDNYTLFFFGSSVPTVTVLALLSSLGKWRTYS